MIESSVFEGDETARSHRERLAELFRQGVSPDAAACSVEHLLGGRKIVLYGAGSGFFTFSVFVLQKYGLKPTAVLDRRFGPEEKEYEGIPAYSPDRYMPTRDEQDSAVVVVTVGKTQYHEEVFACLRRLGFKNIVLSHDIYEYHLLHPPVELEANGFAYYAARQESILQSLDLLEDEPSRVVFLRVLQSHLQRLPLRIPHRPLEEQYFPKDIALHRGYSRFVNCGAYQGDTVLQLHSLHGKLDALACFEPDQKSFASLTKMLCERRHALAHEILAFPCGVFSREVQQRFADGNQVNSRICEHGESLVQCVALDHAIPTFRPTFIQMDIEGVEPDAIQGARELIREHRPDLAICVYHSPHHLWEIPLQIDRMQLGYKFYLRNYTSWVSETVLYATT